MRPSPRVSRTRRALVAGLVALGGLVVAAPASAHVSVKPAETPKGSFSVFSFSVPNERESASSCRSR